MFAALYHLYFHTESSIHRVGEFPDFYLDIWSHNLGLQMEIKMQN